ncbi:hypothetical protein [Streptomyces sp. NPDC046197]
MPNDAAHRVCAGRGHRPKERTTAALALRLAPPLPQPADLGTGEPARHAA